MNVLKYLEEAKLEEVADQLRREGFRVRRPRGAGVDLVAERPGRRVAVEVVAQTRLGIETERLQAARRRAVESGFDEFRLVVVNEPRETKVHIEGLEQRLESYLREQTLSELEVLGSAVRIDEVADIEVDRIDVGAGGVVIDGTGRLHVQVEQGGGNVGDGVTLGSSLPFQFRVVLGASGDDFAVESLRVDTSSYG